ncbi:MAG TPA: elongation factor P [Candidatus Saccharimonadales bacterium]|nr:elongation factor P [Candidatus Saccharimonadales bacterium]
MALNITGLKKGTIFKFNGEPYRVVEYGQKVMGRGGSIVNVRIKSMLDGKVLDKTFKGNEQLESADVDIRKAQYLYKDGSIFFFMDEKTYEQFEVPDKLVSEQDGYLVEGDSYTAQIFEGRLINIDLPNNVALKVTYTEDVVRGDTANSVMKEATLNTGKSIKVPAFVKKDDVIRVDTRTGTYIERA